MKFTCSKNDLIRSVNISAKAIASKSTIPILKGILLSLSENQLTLKSSCLDLSIETSLQVQGFENGKTVIDAKLFGDILKSLPNSLISLFTDDKDNLNIQCLSSSFAIPSFSADEFPSIGEVDPIKNFTVDKNDFCNAIKKTAFAACTDENRGILVGCLLNFLPDYAEMVALDGFRMSIARFTVKDSYTETKAVLHAKQLSDIRKILLENENCSDVKISMDEKNVLFTCNETLIIARLLVGEYMNYQSVLTKSCNTKLFLAKADLQAALERASLFSRNNETANLVRLLIGDNKLVVTARNEEGSANEEVACEIQGNDLKIGFNVRYILDVLKSIDDENIAIKLIDSSSCCLFVPEEGNAYTFFLLPIRISEN